MFEIWSYTINVFEYNTIYSFSKLIYKFTVTFYALPYLIAHVDCSNITLFDTKEMQAMTLKVTQTNSTDRWFTMPTAFVYVQKIFPFTFRNCMYDATNYLGRTVRCHYF